MPDFCSPIFALGSGGSTFEAAGPRGNARINARILVIDIKTPQIPKYLRPTAFYERQSLFADSVTPLDG